MLRQNCMSFVRKHDDTEEKAQMFWIGRSFWIHWS